MQVWERCAGLFWSIDSALIHIQPNCLSLACSNDRQKLMGKSWTVPSSRILQRVSRAIGERHV